MRSTRFALGLVGLVATALVVRFAFVLIVDPEVPAVGDATAYHLLAEQLAAGDGYIRPFDRLEFDAIRPTAEYPPLWPMTVSVASFAGIHSVTGQRLFASLIGAATVAVTGLLGRRVAGEVAGLIAAGVLAVHPLVFQSEATLMPETLYMLLIAGLLITADRMLVRSAPAWTPVALGVLGGLAALTRAEGGLLTLLVAAPLLRRPGGLRKLVLVALGGLLVLAPWTIRNAQVFDRFVPLSNNLGTALDGANCDQTYSGDSLGLWSFSESCFEGFDQARLADQGEAAVAAHHRDEGLAHARDHLVEVPGVMAVRVLRTWGIWDPAQTTFAASTEGRVLAWERAGTALHLVVLLPLAAAGAWSIRDRRTRQWLLLAPIAAVTVTSALTYGNQRFRAGAEPALAVLAAIGVVAVLEVVHRRRTADPATRVASP